MHGLSPAAGLPFDPRMLALPFHAEHTSGHPLHPPALPKDNGRQLFKKELKKHVIIQFPWDPGGSILLHQLGGKPNLKERGMLGTSIGWADAWALGLEPSLDLAGGVQREGGKERIGIEQLSENILPLPSYCSSSPTLSISLVPRFPTSRPSKSF